MRLFVGVELCEEARHAAGQTAAALRERFGRAVTARWISPENLHMTVRFIGHVADDLAPALIGQATAPLPISPFTIRLNGCGVFPRSGPPRVLWIGLTEGLAPLAEIHQELNRRLAPFGFEAEERPFSAHLTLARIKDLEPRTNPGSRERSGSAVAQLRQVVTAIAPTPAACTVSHATLFQSLLSPKGSRYEPLARIPFAR
jgi:2'-5' RNA ligase